MVSKAEIVEALINDNLGYDIGRALLFSVNEGDEGVSITEAGSHGDVYELLESADSRLVAKVSDYVAIVTTGWAAPIDRDTDEGVPPSQHNDRRRVRLVVLATRGQVASVLRFQDEPDDTVTDDGQAVGALADAVGALYED